jgi:hypothetical protein
MSAIYYGFFNYLNNLYGFFRRDYYYYYIIIKIYDLWNQNFLVQFKDTWNLSFLSFAIYKQLWKKKERKRFIVNISVQIRGRFNKIGLEKDLVSIYKNQSKNILMAIIKKIKNIYNRGSVWYNMLG